MDQNNVGLTPAQRAALENQNAHSAPSPHVQTYTTNTPGATLAHEMIGNYQRKLIKLPRSGWVVEIQSLGPGDFLSIYGSSLPAMMTAMGLDADDKAQEQQFRQNMTPLQNAILTEEHVLNFRRIACSAIISLSLTLRPQWMCEPGVASVDRINPFDLYTIYEEVKAISGWAADAERFQDVPGEAEG